jgi:hypothetical protein
MIKHLSNGIENVEKVIRNYKGGKKNLLELPVLDLQVFSQKVHNQDQEDPKQNLKVYNQDQEGHKQVQEAHNQDQKVHNQDQKDHNQDQEAHTQDQEINNQEVVAESITNLTDAQKENLLKEQEQVFDDQLKSLATAIKEIVVVDDEKPRLLTLVEAQEDPIKVL